MRFGREEMPEGETNAEAAARESATGLLTSVLFSPRRAFESISGRPGWILPLALLIVVSVALVFSLGQHVGWRALIEIQFAHSHRLEVLSAEQQQQALDRAASFAPVVGYLGATVGTAIILLAVAGIFLGAFDVVFGSSIGFGRSFAITSYAYLPQALKGLITIVVVWALPPSDIRSINILGTNPGVLWPSAAPWLAKLLSSLDLFTFWTLILMAIGYAVASKRTKLGGAFAVVIALWLVYLLAAVGLTAVFS